ncbi:MAG: hypothetical protein WCV90_01645 [Candidatus Woesearchaeota archaeon]
METKTLDQVIKTKEEFDALAVDIDAFAAKYELVERLVADLIDGFTVDLKPRMKQALEKYDPAIVGDKTRVPIFGTYARAMPRYDRDELVSRAYSCDPTYTVKGELRGWLFLPVGIIPGLGSHVDGSGTFRFETAYGHKEHDSIERILACKEYLFKGFKEQELCKGVTLLLPTEKSVPGLIEELKGRIFRPY